MDAFVNNVRWVVTSPNGDRDTMVDLCMSRAELVGRLEDETLPVPVADYGEKTYLKFDVEKGTIAIPIMDSSSKELPNYLFRTVDDVVITSVYNDEDLVTPYWKAYIEGRVASQKEFLKVYYNEGLIL